MAESEVSTTILGEGIGIVCGAISGNLEVLDFDREGLFGEWFARLRAINADIAEKIKTGAVMVSTPSGGGHLYYRSEEPPLGNSKLAQAAQPFVDRNGKKKVCLIETRGEGGYVVAPPTAGYVVKGGAFDSIITLSPGDTRTLHLVSRSFNEINDRNSTSLRPGDAYNSDPVVKSSDLLAAHGWTRLANTGDCCHLARPGKTSGTSATADFNGGGAYVFSTNAALCEGYHSKFDLYAQLEHGGDYQEAARALGKLGYGEPPEKPLRVPPGVEAPKEVSKAGPPLQIVSWGSEGLTEDLGGMRYLLETHPREDSHGYQEPIGLMPGGDLGLLVGEGGAGKTWLTVQLAVAIASGRNVVGLGVRETGRVMILSSEMRADKMRRRFKSALDAALIDKREDRVDVMNKIAAYAMSDGQSPQLLEKSYGNIRTTETYRWFVEEAAKHEYKLIILDPLASFGGPETEVNARPFCDFLTKIALGPGNPHVLIVHHTNKSSRGGIKTDSTAVRGTSGLTDGPRWQINLERRDRVANQPAFAVLRETKVNDGEEMEGGIWLVRQREYGGALRRAKGCEVRSYMESRSGD